MLRFKSLGNKVSKFDKLETFSKPSGVERVVMVSDEVTANCPVTGAPDWYTVTISYRPIKLCLESKTLKLYLQSFRNQGLFCENFSDRIAEDIYKAINPEYIHVEVVQKPRGGVSITAYAERK